MYKVFNGDGYIYNHYCSDGFSGLYICQILLIVQFKYGGLLHINFGSRLRENLIYTYTHTQHTCCGSNECMG